MIGICTVRKYCGTKRFELSSNRRDVTSVPNIFPSTEYDSRGKKVGSKNSIPVGVNKFSIQLQVTDCRTCQSQTQTSNRSFSHAGIVWMHAAINTLHKSLSVHASSNARTRPHACVRIRVHEHIQTHQYAINAS